MDKDVKMALRGRLEDIIVKITPQIYRHNMIYEKGRPVLYVTLKKALYGCLRLAFLLYARFVAEMRGKGFEINPYDPRKVNKRIGGKNMTVCWYVDDMKVSHVDPTEVTSFMKWIEVIYGELRITRGNVHAYIGMDLDLWNT